MIGICFFNPEKGGVIFFFSGKLSLMGGGMAFFLPYIVVRWFVLKNSGGGNFFFWPVKKPHFCPQGQLGNFFGDFLPKYFKRKMGFRLGRIFLGKNRFLKNSKGGPEKEKGFLFWLRGDFFFQFFFGGGFFFPTPPKRIPFKNCGWGLGSMGKKGGGNHFLTLILNRNLGKKRAKSGGPFRVK